VRALGLVELKGAGEPFEAELETPLTLPRSSRL